MTLSNGRRAQRISSCTAMMAALAALFFAVTTARADVQENVQFTGEEQTGQMAVDLAGTLAATEPITGIIGIDNIPVQTLVIEVTDGPVQAELNPATAATDCQGLASAGATIETGASGELVDVRGLVLELMSPSTLNLGVDELELRICLTDRCGGVGEIFVRVEADADVDSILFCQEGSAVVTPTGVPGEFDVSVSGTVIVAGEWRAPLRVSGVPIPLSDDYDFDVPITFTGKATQSGRGLSLDLSQLVNPSISIEYDVAVELEEDPPLIVDPDGFLVAEATAGLGLAIHLQTFSNTIPPPPEEGFPFEVTRFSNTKLATQDRVVIRADFDAPIPDNSDLVTISLDGQVIFSDEFRTFRSGLFGDDVYENNSLLGLDVTLDFGAGELRVGGTVRPRIDADLSDGLTVELDLGSDTGSDTVEIDVTLGILWSLAQCSQPGSADGDECQRGDGVCEAGFCRPVGLCAGVICDDANDCTRDVCDPGSGSCSFFVKRDGTLCDDDTGACLAGECLPLTCDCDDGNECTEDVCDPADASCSSSPVADGTICRDGVCDGGVCTNLCAVTSCDDGQSCTFDLCDPVTGGCFNPPKLDGLPCEGGTCQAGACVPDFCPNDCVDDNPCTVGACNTETGVCRQVPLLGSPCVLDGEPGFCVEVDPGNSLEVECDVSDLCAGGCPDLGECIVNECIPSSGNCISSNVLEGTSCDGGAGQCISGECQPLDPCADVICDDSNECTEGVCSEGECSYSPVLDGTPCDGGAGSCKTGNCVPSGSFFDVTSLTNVRLVTQDYLRLRADFTADIPDGDDEVVITIDGQEIFREKFRTFRTGLFGDDDVFENNSLLGLDVRLDFGAGELRVTGTQRPKLDADLAQDGLTVTLEIGDAFAGVDTVPIDIFLGILWTLDE